MLLILTQREVVLLLVVDSVVEVEVDIKAEEAATKEDVEEVLVVTVVVIKEVVVVVTKVAAVLVVIPLNNNRIMVVVVMVVAIKEVLVEVDTLELDEVAEAMELLNNTHLILLNNKVKHLILEEVCSSKKIIIILLEKIVLNKLNEDFCFSCFYILFSLKNILFFV